MKFLKVNVSGNDFILVEPGIRELGRLARLLCRRKLVGADGIITWEPGPSFVYYNYMGQRVPFCGNGTRALAWYLVSRGLAPSSLSLRTPAGDAELRVEGRFVWLNLGVPKHLGPGLLRVMVEHVVAPLEGEAGERARDLGWPGRNVNLWRELKPGVISVRSFEAGHREEAGSCGTGAGAAAWVYMRERGLSSSVVMTHSGDELRYRVERGRLWLGGEVLPVFRGELLLELQ